MSLQPFPVPKTATFLDMRNFINTIAQATGLIDINPIFQDGILTIPNQPDQTSEEMDGSIFFAIVLLHAQRIHLRFDFFSDSMVAISNVHNGKLHTRFNSWPEGILRLFETALLSLEAIQAQSTSCTRAMRTQLSELERLPRITMPT